MSVFFSGCRNLQLLSIHVALDKGDDIDTMHEVHCSSLEHLVPSEGYERYMFKCPLCLESYDYAFVVRSENMAARIFAEKLPNLSEIRWLDLWAWDNFDEGCQRRIKITRQGNATKLIRDDEREESRIVL
ncbi:uncharacterized protein FOMMEDRAFT_16005 [Fomitiporia mediterranea MF3/22]|uniref:uncharacterized protein n=1 Tax=Fomitiporia mediterranea (strain MF3/22) TaxID=694068 RepID=UPI0004409525|nr:uncharacterized protein FOMMEDRAFT_16005 [Fomitiporia mediterranea MF3/22]EJD07307.1 hypothetical protein FOMMEDRAFT_16005 [Fomitiporia mediterranea MF3/22]